jgi:hypothetical protein
VLKHATTRQRDSPAEAAAVASACGYITAVTATIVALGLVVICQWPERLHAEQGAAQSFVTDVLRLMEAPGLGARVPSPLQCEVQLAALLDGGLPQQRFEPAFRQALHNRWQGAPLVAVRRRRLLLAAPVINALAAQATLDAQAARKAADVAKRGLRECALPGCGAVEMSVKEFKLCGACRAAAYCCAEHAAAHWKRKPDGHKAACKQSQASAADAEQ